MRLSLTRQQRRATQLCVKPHINRKHLNRIRSEVRVRDRLYRVAFPGQNQAEVGFGAFRIPQGHNHPVKLLSLNPLAPVCGSQAVFFRLDTGFDLGEILALYRQD